MCCTCFLRFAPSLITSFLHFPSLANCFELFSARTLFIHSIVNRRLKKSPNRLIAHHISLPVLFLACPPFFARFCSVYKSIDLLTDFFPLILQMEKIKRANNLWTNDSIFLHKTLNIPVDPEQSPTIGDKPLKDTINLPTSNLNNNSINSFSPRTCNNLNQENNNNNHVIAGSGSPASKPNCNGSSDRHVAHDLVEASTSGKYQSSSSSTVVVEDLASANKVEAVQNYLSRIDHLIAKSKVQMDCLAATGSEICKSVSEDDLFRVRTHLTKRQHSLRSNDIRLSNVGSERKSLKNGVFSFRKLEQEQDDEYFEL